MPTKPSSSFRAPGISEAIGVKHLSTIPEFHPQHHFQLGASRFLEAWIEKKKIVFCQKVSLHPGTIANF